MLDYTSPLASAPEAPRGYRQLNAASRFLELRSLQKVSCIPHWKCWSSTLKQMLQSGEGKL